MKKRTNRNRKKQKARRNSKRKTRKLSKKYNSRGGGIFWNSGYKLYKGPPPIVMDPIILFKSTTDTDEQCDQIKQLMSANKTFVRVPQSIEHLIKNDFVENHNPEGVLCGFSSLLIPGWFETFDTLQIAELYIRETDNDTVGTECGLENYIWPTDALGHIENSKTTVKLNESIMGLRHIGILLSSFMGYIYDPKNNILDREERAKYRVYYDDRHLDSVNFVQKYNGDLIHRIRICELVKSCFKTYSQFVKFVTTIQRHKTFEFGQSTSYDQTYQANQPVSHEDAQYMSMNSRYAGYTETLLPENRKLVGLYIQSRNKDLYRTTNKKYEFYKAAAIKKATELDLTLYSLDGPLPSSLSPPSPSLPIPSLPIPSLPTPAPVLLESLPIPVSLESSPAPPSVSLESSLLPPVSPTPPLP
jgi:hypothetical protein